MLLYILVSSYSDGSGDPHVEVVRDEPYFDGNEIDIEKTALLAMRKLMTAFEHGNTVVVYDAQGEHVDTWKR